MTSSRRLARLAVPLVMGLVFTGLTGVQASAAPELDPRILAPSRLADPQPSPPGASTAAARSTEVVTPIPAGGSVSSPDGSTQLRMQLNGNLVVHRNGRALWNSGTYVEGSILRHDVFGNLIVVRPEGAWTWTTTLDQASKTVIGNDGALRLLDEDGSTLWSSAAPDEDTHNGELVASMRPGESFLSGVGGRLVMQRDGNLVSYSRSGRVVFQSNTHVPGSRFVVQDDGNVVIYGPDGRWLWNTRTNGSSSVPLLYEGELYVVDEELNVLFYSGEDTGQRNPTPVRSLASGESVRSLNGRYTLVMRTDGNLVIRNAAGRNIWTTRTAGRRGASFAVQPDGNLVVRSGSRVHWASGTHGHPGAELTLLDDGRLMLRSARNRVLWRSSR